MMVVLPVPPVGPFRRFGHALLAFSTVPILLNAVTPQRAQMQRAAAEDPTAALKTMLRSV